MLLQQCLVGFGFTMKEKKNWEYEWQGLKFAEIGIKPSLFKQASRDFYDAFYYTLFDKYKSFAELPVSWQLNKLAVATEIKNWLPRGSSVLSYGCGLGFVEHEVLKVRNDIKLRCFDISDIPGKWFKSQNSKIHFSDALEKNEQFDIIMCIQLTYSLDREVFVKIFKSLQSKLTENGKILCVDHSIINEENGIICSSVIEKFIWQIKPLFRPIYNYIFRRNKAQFWGWLRDNEMRDFLFA